MAEIIIKIEKDDINTTKIGDNIMIKCGKMDLSLVFTPEAVEELIYDYNQIKKIN